MYNVSKAIFPNEILGEREEYIIEDEGDYNTFLFLPNKYLRLKSIYSIKSGRQYAYVLTDFLNYMLIKKKKNFKNATKKDLKDYFYVKIFGNDSGLFYISKGQKTGSSANFILTVLNGFYNFLFDMGINLLLDFKIERKSNPHSFLYGNIWYKEMHIFIDRNIKRLKGTKEFVKWYTEDEINAILINLKTIRDKAIFALTLEGLRIDEVLTVQIDGYIYNTNEKPYVELFASKGRQTGNTCRTVALKNSTIKLINDYIFLERDMIINILYKKKGKIPKFLFINIKKGVNFGEPVKYNNYREILKRAASMAGMDMDKIRTHSGRSTRVMELLHFQSDHPDENLTDEMIRQIMGWRNGNSILPYVNTMDSKTSKKILEKIEKYNIGISYGEQNE